MLKQAEQAPDPLRKFTPGLDLMDAYVWVRDIRAIEEDFRQRNTPVTEGPLKREYGCTEIVVHDPDGRRIVFGHCP